MHQTTPLSLGLISLASLWSHAHCSPVAQPGPQADGTPLSYNPGGPMISASPTPMSVNPGGPLLPTDPPLSFNPGGPMEPVTPVPESTPKPMSVQPGGPMKPPHHQRDEGYRTTSKPTSTTVRSSSKSCTWTTSVMVTDACSWNGVETIYPTTTVSTRYIDCHGCSDLDIDPELWYCPIEIITATEVVHTPRTVWRMACATSTVTAHGPGTTPVVVTPIWTPTAASGVGRRTTPQGDLMDQNPAACPTTYVVQPGQSAGSTSTYYQQTATETMRLPCAGCPLVLSTALAGYGPPGSFTTTVTAPLGTTITYVCQ